MMKQEFESLIGKQVSDKDYEMIDRVYTFHPAISEVEGKKQIVDFYNAGGMALIRDMLETANIMSSLEKELGEAKAALEKVVCRIQNVKDNGIEYEKCRKDLLFAYYRSNSLDEWNFSRKMITGRYGSNIVEHLMEELKLRRK